MSDSLKYINNVLLSIDNALTTCCCNDGQYFWEGLPCDMDIQFRSSICAEWDKCQYGDRVYFEYQSRCEGDEYRICECQRLNIKADTISSPKLIDDITVTYAGAGNLTLEWGTESATVTEGSTVNTYDFDDTSNDTLFEIFTAINSDYPNLSLTPTNLSWNLPPYVVSGETLNFVGASTKYLDSVSCGLIFRWQDQTTPLAEYNSTLSTFASNIQTALNTLGGPTFSVEYNSRASTINSGYFSIVFGGAGCGSRQPNIYIDKMRLLYASYNGVGDAHLEYGDYNCGWGTNSSTTYNSLDRYYISSGYLTTGCPLEWRAGSGPIIHATGGQFGIQCCPQRGAIIGPPQNLNQNLSGYYENSDFSNLERTVRYNGACYQIDPFYFMVGKEGRFTQNWSNKSFSTYIIPSCRYNESGLCGQSVTPENCAPELFLPQLHPDIPWGPFGSYHAGIESEAHPSEGTLSARVGFDYAPYAHMKTLGSWTRTTGIVVNLKYYRNIPFYIGSTIGADDLIGGTIKTTSVPAGFSLEDNTIDATYIKIVFDPNGRTVGDFVNGLNSLRGSGLTDDDSCYLFKFCLAHDDVSDIPAYKILNNSAEIWDMRKIRLMEKDLGWAPPGQETEYVQAYNPETDVIEFFSPTEFWNKLMSGSDIFPAEVSYNDRFAEVKYGFQVGFSYTYQCNTIQNENVTRPSLFVNPPEDVFATLPPYCRHKKTLPNHSGLINVGTDTLSSTKHYEGEAQPRLIPWWTAMQGTTENLLNISLNPSTPETIHSMNVWVSGRTIFFSGLRYNGSTPVGTLDSIPTDRGGARYIIPSAILDISGIQYTPLAGGSAYSPLIANSGTYPFEVLLDDSTWMDSVTEFPVESGTVGAVRTSHNWAYVEPLLDTSPVDIKNGTAQLPAFVRLRHDWYNEADDTYLNSPRKLPRCVPPNATIVGSGVQVDCESDKVIDGSWIVSYGCTSTVCKTTWFMQTSRCPCSTEFACDEGGGSTVPHRFNQEGNALVNSDRWSNTGGHTTYVNQPTLYICSLNWHRDCDIQSLVKVPYQIVIDEPDTLCDSDITVRYAYTNGVVSTPHGDASNSYEFAVWNGEGEGEGWCQYIDPANPGSLISKEDIPKTWPPKAYIAERSDRVFCSTNIYPFSFDALCNDTAVYTLEGWDRIQNIYPLAPPEYSDSSNRGCGTPTSDDVSLLNALFRPIVNNITNGDLCPGGNCDRVDINCSTKCCGCFFVCNPDDGGCGSLGPKYYPERYTVSYTETVTITDGVEICDTVPHSSVPSCNQGCCTDTNGSFVRHPSWGVRYNVTVNASFEMQINATCEICLGSGSETITKTVDAGLCTGDYLPPCADNYCNNGCQDCCDYVIVNPIGCNNYESYATRATVCSEDSSTTITAAFCSCGGGGGSLQCSYPMLRRDTYNITCTNTFGSCGFGTKTREVSNTYDADGGTIDPQPSCLNGTILQYPDGNQELTTEERTASFTQSQSTYAACGGGTQSGKTLPYITGWMNGASWYCGINGFKSTEDDSEYI